MRVSDTFSFVSLASQSFVDLMINNKSFSFTASSLKICKLNDPKRDECIKDSIQTFLPELHVWNEHDFVD